MFESRRPKIKGGCCSSDDSDETPIIRKRKKSRTAKPVLEDEDVITPVVPARNRNRERQTDSVRPKKRKEREVLEYFDDEAVESCQEEQKWMKRAS